MDSATTTYIASETHIALTRLVLHVPDRLLASTSGVILFDIPLIVIPVRRRSLLVLQADRAAQCAKDPGLLFRQRRHSRDIRRSSGLGGRDGKVPVVVEFARNSGRDQSRIVDRVTFAVDLGDGPSWTRAVVGGGGTRHVRLGRPQTGVAERYPGFADVVGKRDSGLTDVALRRVEDGLTQLTLTHLGRGVPVDADPGDAFATTSSGAGHVVLVGDRIDGPPGITVAKVDRGRTGTIADHARPHATRSTSGTATSSTPIARNGRHSSIDVLGPPLSLLPLLHPGKLDVQSDKEPDDDDGDNDGSGNGPLGKTGRLFEFGRLIETVRIRGRGDGAIGGGLGLGHRGSFRSRGGELLRGGMDGKDGTRSEHELRGIRLDDPEVEVRVGGIVPPGRLEFAQIVAPSAIGGLLEHLSDPARRALVQGRVTVQVDVDKLSIKARAVPFRRHFVAGLNDIVGLGRLVDLGGRTS